MESLSKSDLFRLVKFEKWATYVRSNGAISIESVISADGGKNFSTILSNDDCQLASFDMNNIPQADVLLVWGENLQAARYGAEIAVRYKRQYGNYPAFVTSGGAFYSGQQVGRTQAECYEQIMLALGFPKDWVMRYHSGNKVLCAAEDIRQKLHQVPHLHKLKVLAVTSAGYSLLAAQDIVPICPEVDFCFFETPSTSLDKRYQDCEKFGPDGYGVDLLMANLLYLRMGDGREHLRLSGAKLCTAPTKRDIRHFLEKGYAAFCNKPEMWQYLGCNPEKGLWLCRFRREYLDSLPQGKKHDAKQIKKLIFGIQSRLKTLGLTID